MNTQIRYAAYSLIAISIVLTLLLAYPEVNGSRAKARAVVPLPTPTPVGRPGVASPLGENTALARTNFALAAHGGMASASSSFPGSAPSGAIDGDRKGLNFGKDGYWNSKDATFPQWLEVDLKGKRPITEIGVFTIQDEYARTGLPTPSR